MPCTKTLYLTWEYQSPGRAQLGRIYVYVWCGFGIGRNSSPSSHCWFTEEPACPRGAGLSCALRAVLGTCWAPRKPQAGLMRLELLAAFPCFCLQQAHSTWQLSSLGQSCHLSNENAPLMGFVILFMSGNWYIEIFCVSNAESLHGEIRSCRRSFTCCSTSSHRCRPTQLPICSISALGITKWKQRYVLLVLL